MHDALAEALALPGLWWLAAGVFVAGAVRGFAGFGNGMIHLALAAQVLPPIWAIISLIVCDLLGPALLAPRVLRDAHLPDLMRLFAGVVLALPFGMMLLFATPAEVFRVFVSCLALGLLLCLVLGLRYRGRLTPPLVFATGGISGLAGGAVGLGGPPVILLYLASPFPAKTIRANTLLFLLGYDIIKLIAYGIAGVLSLVPVMIGLTLSLPNALGNFVGAALFRPGYERVYRGVAYAIIAASALSGLPIWGA